MPRPAVVQNRPQSSVPAVRSTSKGRPANRISPAPIAKSQEILAERRARAAALRAQGIEYIDHASFSDPAAATVILGSAPAVPVSRDRVRIPDELPSYLANLYEVPLLTREQEGYYFRKLNFLKHRAARLREAWGSRLPSEARLNEVESLLREAGEVKNFLVRSNLRLVVAVARKSARAGVNFFEVVSDGNLSLMRAVEKFDFSRGFKFSTYATWAIRKNFARSVPAEFTQLNRFRTGADELFQVSSDNRSSAFAEERQNQHQHEMLTQVLQRLQDRDREIIMLRFGLEDGTEPLTLEQVGQHMGVSKERIRQLETRALGRMREIASTEKLDLVGI